MKAAQIIFTSFRRSRWAAYLLAAGLAALTLLVRVIIGSRFEGPTMIVFTIPIILSAYWGGMGPGLLATMLSALGAAYYILPPIFSFNILSTTERWQEAILVLAGLVISFICEMLHRSRHRAENIIAELQQKERELEAAFAERRESEVVSARLAAIVASSDDAIIGKDLNSTITSWNKSAENIFGYSAVEMVGTSIMRLIPADRHDEESQILAKIKRGENVEHFETQRQTKDGRLIDVSVTASPIKDTTGKIIGVSKVARDISARKQAEAAQRASERRLRTVTDNARVGLVMVNSERRYTFANATYAEILGLPSSDLIGQRVADVLAPLYEEQIRPNLDRAFAGERVAYELHRPTTGGDCYYTVKYEPTKIGGSVSLVVAVITDITERKAAAEKILQLNVELELRVIKRTAELEAANKELEAFSYSVSHDLRAPLRAVNGFAGIVLEDFGSQLSEEGRDYLERIRNGGQRMGVLIDDLLAFSRLSRQSVNRQSVATTKLAQNVLEELKPQLDGRRIEIKVGELAACHGDPALLKQVWVNLISNAVKYTREREPAIVEIGCARENGEDVYFVRDNGAGFDMQYANKLFGVFQRLHRTDEFEGTGVGLAIVQRIVHRHGGRVWAEAKVNQGATFYFTLQGEDKS